ncbi:hypothetical protein [Clostridium colicanis]|uniref:RiboL-PSP-HEPN domain-containing protein n=1 Tax=Clostridium colicanis DSM 13634 TaxID=1121305 RepID=A0A151ARQ0_9CLOT|nr:hypothetical protein [Clostridium colicanis]KYH30067.1 hypothetical protein CLCOL_00050 [Clostridium colicanis DSM 13634]
MESSIGCTVTITNMSSELFDDALYYKELSEKTDDFFLKRRYQRTSLICFCASAEAWMNQVIKEQLKNKKTLTQREQELFDFINNADKDIPKGYSNIRKRLYNFLPNTIIGKTINWSSNKQDVFENYIELSGYRNSVVHYVSGKVKDLEVETMKNILNKAPDIIEELFEKYADMGSLLKVPSWYKERKSRVQKLESR